MEINKKEKEVFVIKEVFPHGAIGEMRLNRNHKIVETDGQLAEKLGYSNAEDLVGQSFFNLFLAKEKVRLNYFLKHSTREYLSVLSALQLRKNKSGLNWISVYGKRENRSDNESGYSVVFLHEEESFASMTTDRFDAFYRSFFDMYETELAQIGLSLRDDIAQELYALRVSLQKFILSNGYDKEISVLKKRLNETIRKVSDLSNDLLPNVFVHMGFLPAMEDMVFAVNRLGYNLKYKIDSRIKDKSPEFQFCCYRVIQALLQSWKQHIIPDEASLSITVRGNRVHIKLDESRSGTTNRVHNYPEATLHNIRNRIALYDGALEVNRILENSQVRITMYN